MKKGIVILGLISAISLSACGSIPVLNSSSDDSEVIAQSKAVIEQSKAVVEESEAVEKAKGNNDIVEENEAIGETEQAKKSEQIPEESHPLAILEYQGKRYDMANMTLSDVTILSQNMGIYMEANLTRKIEPYYKGASGDNGKGVGEYTGSYAHMDGTVYNPYNREITAKDMQFNYFYLSVDELSIEKSDLLLFNGHINGNSTPEECIKAFKEYGVEPNDNIGYNGRYVEGEFTLKDGRLATVSIDFNEDSNTIYDFHFDTDIRFFD